ncbi:transcription antitermination factor NusB [Proteocatella sphenisci]|uniref:transcription antitermination factor NusB n=1 Tax=Proteocatella sphenisci TaxID=181070 RepID=UPI00048CD923|nr:transcription antitermination factor NusB [Proteocatella sphenisci]
MGRRDERQKAVELLYEMVVQKEDETSYINEYFDKYELDKENLKFAKRILETYFDNKEEVNAAISENLQKWKMERLGKIDLSIIRAATTEMLYFDDVPEAVSINEAVELAKLFSEEKAFKFINKVLRNIFESTKKGE